MISARDDYRRFLIGIVSVLVYSCLPLQAQSASGNDIAIVAHSGIPVNDLSFAELRKMVLGDRQYWAPNLRVTLLLRAPVARERDVVLQRVYGMTEAQFRQYWIGKVFRAELAAGPKIVNSTDAAIGLVSSTPGSIAFISSAEVPANLKILRIDGKLPGQQGYALH